MIVHAPSDFLAHASQCAPGAAPSILPRGVLMIEPADFWVSPESAVDNPYVRLETPADAERALRQSRALQAAIEACGVPVVTFPGVVEAPDGVFVNNVFATAAGQLIVGAMRHPGRRPEARRQDIRDHFTRRGYRVRDLSQQGCVAELTGPLVIDRARGIGYCGLTGRVDAAGVQAMHEAFGLRLTFCFELAPAEYHANVVLSVLAGRACVLCPEAFADPRVPAAIARVYGDRTLAIDGQEKASFAGNCIALTDRHLFMSRTAGNALAADKRDTLSSWGFELRTVPLDEFEKAGGSLRCLVAEIF